MAEVRLEDAPRKARELFEKGFAAMERGNLDYAIDMFMSVLDLEPRLLHVRRFLRAAEVRRFKDAGKGGISHAISSLSGIGGVMSVKSLINKKPLEALKAAEKLLQKDPLNAQFILLLADAAEAADMPEVAIQTLSIVREYEPDNVKILNRYGEFLLKMNDTQTASEVYEHLLRLKPNDPEYVKKYKDVSALHTMNKGGWEGATSFRDMIKDSKGTELLEQESKAVKSATDLDALIASALGKMEKEPGNVNYVRALADLYVRAEQFDAAIEALEKAQALSGGGDPQVDLMLSNIRVQKLERSIQAKQEAGDAAGAAEVQEELDRYRLGAAQERVARYPNDLQFKYDLGVLLYENENITEAVQQFQAAQRNPQRRINSLYYLALCFKHKGQMDIAREQLQTAVAELPVMDGLKKDVLYELGVLSEALKDRESALSYFKQIYAVDIGFKDVQEKIDKFYSSGA